MLNLNSFPIRLLQTIIAFIDHCEGFGITEIRTMRQEIQNHITKQATLGRVHMSQEEKKQSRINKASRMRKMEADKKWIKCPSCINGLLVERGREGVRYVACTVHGGYGCGYSKEIK